jgi:hypothetical protein
VSTSAAVATIPTVTVALPVTVSFCSDSTESPLGLCASVVGGSPLGLCASAVGGCNFTETGEVQTVGTITWLGAGGTTVRTDTLEFSSDTDAVPEPASWLLVLTGLPLMGLRRLRRPPVGS